MSESMQSREAELQYLENYYEKDGNHLIVLYGQRNIGKTSIIAEFSKDKNSYYYKAKACSEREQQYQWAREFPLQRVGLPEYPSFQDIFHGIMKESTGKKIIVVDGFENVIKNSTRFMQDVIELLHKQEEVKSVLIIFCSSSIGWVENSMIAKLGKAAYEISGFLKIREESFFSLREYFREYTAAQAVETYAVLGGQSNLWQVFDKTLSTKENICKYVLCENSFLLEESVRGITEELRETSVYYTILASLASEKHKLNDLYRHTGFSRAKISVYLKNLMELELVEKVFSFDCAGRKNTQKGIYRIKNSLLHFYFKYVYPNLSNLRFQDEEIFYDEFIKPTFKKFVSNTYKKACTECIEVWNQEKKLPFAFERSGEWVGKVGTIDLIAQKDENQTLMMLSNWDKNKMSFEEFEWLLFCEEKAKIHADYIYLFSEMGFDKKIEDEAKAKKSILLNNLSSL